MSDEDLWYPTACDSCKKMSNPNSGTPGLASWRAPSLLPCSLAQPFLSSISDLALGEQARARPWTPACTPHCCSQRSQACSFAHPHLTLPSGKGLGWPPCVSWSEGGTQTHQMEEARVGEWGWVFHAHGRWRVVDLGPVLKVMVWHHGWHGRVGIGVGPTEVLRVGLHVVALCRGL